MSSNEEDSDNINRIVQADIEQAEDSLDNSNERIRRLERLLAQQQELMKKQDETMKAQLAELKDSLSKMVAPKPILVKRNTEDEIQVSQNDDTEGAKSVTDFPQKSPLFRSRASSRASSKASSRVSSQFHSRDSSREGSVDREKGILPLLQNMLYSQKLMLKKDEKRYPNAYNEIKKYVHGHDTIRERIKADESNLLSVFSEFLDARDAIKEQEMFSHLNRMVAHSMGLSSVEGIEKYTFDALPEHKGNETTADNASKNMLKEFSKINKEGETVRHLLQALISRYNKKLTAQQFIEVVVTCCSGKFKDLIRNAFKGRDLNKAIKHILLAYGNIETPAEKLTAFQRLRLDYKNLRSSLQSVLDAATDCFCDTYEEQAIVDKAIEHSLKNLPDHVKSKVNETRTTLAEAKRKNPNTELMDYRQFIRLVEKEMRSYDPKAIAQERKNVRQIKANEAKSTTESQSQIASEQTKNFQTQMVAAVAALTDRIGSMQSSQQSQQAQYSNTGAKPKQKPQLLHMGSLDYNNGLRHLEQKGPLVDVANEQNNYNFANRKREKLTLKSVADPYKPIPYKTDNNGRLIPSAPPIDFPPLIQFGLKNYRLSDKLLERISTNCHRCGHPACGQNSYTCLYSSPDSGLTFDICPECKQGFHRNCRMYKPLNPSKN